jgi:hypothetical protein
MQQQAIALVDAVPGEQKNVGKERIKDGRRDGGPAHASRRFCFGQRRGNRTAGGARTKVVTRRSKHLLHP